MIGVNLIPEPVVWGQKRRRRLRGWMIAGATALFASAIPIGLEGWRRTQAEELREQRAEVEREVDVLGKELAQLTADVGESFLQIQRAKALRAKRSWSAMLTMVASTMPSGCWLTLLATVPEAPSGTPPRNSPASPEPNGAIGKKKETKGTITIEVPRALRLVGYASEADEPINFVTNLKNAGAFERVDLERSVREPVDDGSYFRFEIVCEW